MKEKIQLKDLIASIQERRYTRVESIAAGGMLELYKSKSGAFAFYFRFDFNRKTTRIRLGLYDSSAPPASLKPTKKGYSLAAARYKSNELAAKHQEAKAVGGLEAVIKEEKAIEEEKKAELAAAGYSLEKMYALYAESIDLLETRRQIKSLFNKNLKLAFPEIAEKQANKVTREDVFEVLKSILDAGHKRTAEKMHSYLRAAYEKAMNVTRDVTISAEFKNFKIKHNPITDITMSGKKRNDKNPLSERDLQKYYKLLGESDSPEAAFLKLHLCTAGQRVAQLKRLKNKDIRRDLITIYDIKGRGDIVRSIHLPLLPVAAEALKKIRTTVSDDAINISETALRRFVDSVVRKEIYDFEIKRVRSGVTTLLSKLKISQEIRNNLQSHNQNTVDSEHYNGYDFYEEKKDALKKMHDFLTGDAA